MGGGGSPSATAPAAWLNQGRFTRDLTNDINYRVRGAISWDVRQQTEYGTLRTYIRFGAENTTPHRRRTTFSPFWDRAFIQFAGFTVGRSQSFFDLVTYGGAYSYHNVRVSGDTGASGQNLWAYTAQFGNGFSGISAEDPATRKGARWTWRRPAFDPGHRWPSTTRSRSTTPTGLRLPGAGPHRQPAGRSAVGLRRHQRCLATCGAYYGRHAAVNVLAERGQRPSPDKYGWAVAGGAKFNLKGGDAAGFNVCYAEGAPGFCTNNSAFALHQHQRGLRLDRRRRLRQRHPASSPRCGALWPSTSTSGTRWRTSWFGGYVNVDYGSNATNLILQRPPGGLRPAACPDRAGRHGDRAPAGQQLQPRLRLLGSGLADAVEPGPAARYRSRSALLQAQHRLRRPRRRARVGLAASSYGHRRPGRLVRDVPLAAQLLSMMA